jgi:ribonuclease PH
LQADGGTRTAAITGAFVALALAVKKLMAEGKLAENPLLKPVAAVSAGIVRWPGHGSICCYTEDAAAAVDMNLVMQRSGRVLLKCKGPARRPRFTEEQLAALLKHGKAGIRQLLELQQAALA